MMRPAFWFGVMVAAVVFVRLTYVGGQGALDRCYVLPEQPGAIVCGARLAHAAPLEGAATVETILAGPLPTALPTPNHAGSVQPTWQIPACRELWPAFVAAGEEFGVDPALVQIVGLVESGCGQAQSSPAGAQGVMQVMPGTAASLAPAVDWRTNKAENIRLGARYLAASMRAYGKPESEDPDYARTIRLTSLAYNGGPGMALRELRGHEVATESRYHAKWVTGMWAERRAATSPTLDEWCKLSGWCRR